MYNVYINIIFIYFKKLQLNDGNTIKTCKVNTNVSHESVKLCDMDFSWTNKCIPFPFKKKNRLYKVSEAELSLGNIKTDVKWFQDYLHSLPNFTIHRIWWIIIPF